MADDSPQPPSPKLVEINGGMLVIAVDAIVCTLNVTGCGFKFSSQQREQAANALLAILNGATFTVVKTDGEAEA